MEEINFKKGDILEGVDGLYMVRNVHKDGSYTIVTYYSEKYKGRFTLEEMKSIFSSKGKRWKHEKETYSPLETRGKGIMQG